MRKYGKELILVDILQRRATQWDGNGMHFVTRDLVGSSSLSTDYVVLGEPLHLSMGLR